MAVPKFQELLMPILKILSGKEEQRVMSIGKQIATDLKLTEDDLQEKLPNWDGNLFRDRVSWAMYFLKKYQLVENTKKGFYQITERGIKALEEKPDNIRKYLKKFDVSGNNKFQNEEPHTPTEHDIELTQFQKKNEDLTSDDMINNSLEVRKKELKAELLNKLQETDPFKFESIILKLMEKMNYGRPESTPKSHDGGIDGVIYGDELGLEQIYMQAKRYADNNKVNEKEMRDFVGALATKPFNKAVFVTTSYFDKKAEKTAEDAQGKNIQLVNGDRLVGLMIKHNIGVRTKQLIEIKELDNDFFEDEEF